MSLKRSEAEDKFEDKKAKLTKSAAIARSKILGKQKPPAAYIVAAIADIVPAVILGKKRKLAVADAVPAVIVGAEPAGGDGAVPAVIGGAECMDTRAKCPFTYKGGKIYHSRPRELFRAYLRTTDKVETVWKVLQPCDDASHALAFADACRAIDQDPRPRV